MRRLNMKMQDLLLELKQMKVIDMDMQQQREKLFLNLNIMR